MVKLKRRDKPPKHRYDLAGQIEDPASHGVRVRSRNGPAARQGGRAGAWSATDRN